MFTGRRRFRAENKIQEFDYENDIGDYDSNTTSDDNEEQSNNEKNAQRGNTITTDEFSIFIKDIKNIDMCNLFTEHSKNFGFGNYIYRLIKLLDIDSYKNESLKKIILDLKPKYDSHTISDEEFLYRLFDFTIRVVNEPHLEEASMEILLLFNLLNSPRAIIKRDDTNDSDSPTLIGSYDMKRYNFPSRLRYFVSLNILDIYEFSCKPDLLLKRIRHPSYQDKCKNNTISKYFTDFFLNSLSVIKHSIRDDRDSHDETMRQYKQFLKSNKTICEIKTNGRRQQISQDIQTIQNYPSLRRNLIEEILNNICKTSLSIERYVATRTNVSMENENYQYPCFLHFKI